MVSDQRYWSEYRRNYEENMRRKMEEDRLQPVESAAPASGNTAKHLK